MHIQLPENGLPAGKQPLHPDLLHQVIRDTAENHGKNKRNFAVALAGVVVAVAIGWHYLTNPTPTKESSRGGIPEIVYPDKPKSPIAATKAAPIPKTKTAPTKSEGEKWGESALPTDADTKTEGITIGEFEANNKKIAEMERQLENAKRQVVEKEVAPVKKSLSEMENESEAAIKAAREGKTTKQPIEKKGEVRWWLVALVGLVVAVIWGLWSSAKHDDNLHNAMSFPTNHGH